MSCPAIKKSDNQVCGKPSKYGVFCGIHKQKEADTSIMSKAVAIGISINTDTGDKPTFIEVCAGCGGLSSGLIKAGFRALLLNDIDRDCCKTLALNHRDTNIVCGSFTEIDWSPYIVSQNEAGKLDILASGIPCQSWSFAGKREGLDSENGELFPKFIEIVHLIKPKVFLIENVKGLLSHRNEEGEQTFQHFINLIEEKGMYNLTFKVLNANDYGVAQKRERVIIVGVLKSLSKTYTFPLPLQIKPVLRDVLLPPPTDLSGSKYSAEKAELFKLIPQGGNWRNMDEAGCTRASIEERQKAYMKGCFHSEGGRTGILYRCSMDKPCLTILCSPSQAKRKCLHFRNRQRDVIPLRIDHSLSEKVLAFRAFQMTIFLLALFPANTNR